MLRCAAHERRSCIETTQSNILFKIWRPGTNPESDLEMLTLRGRTSLQVFLEALARGNTLFRNQQFIITYECEQEAVSRGIYRVHLRKAGKVHGCIVPVTNYEPELLCHQADALLDDIMREEWNHMVDRMHDVDEEVTDPQPYKREERYL